MKKNLMKFSNNDVTRFIQYQLNFMSKLRNSFDYVSEKLMKLGFFLDITDLEKVDLETQLKWNKGKNYNWGVIKCDNLLFIVRHFRSHFTVYCKEIKIHTEGGVTYDCSEYGAFTFQFHSEKLKEAEICEEAKGYTYPQDYYNCDNVFHDFNNMIKVIVKGFKDGYGRMLWNDSAIKRPSHVELKDVIMGESIYSVDKLIFCGEELGSQHMELYAENEMFDMVKEIAKMEKPEGVKSVHTNLKDGYYHGVGIYFEGDSHMQDVYSLTSYCHEKVEKLLNDNSKN